MYVPLRRQVWHKAFLDWSEQERLVNEDDIYLTIYYVCEWVCVYVCV